MGRVVARRPENGLIEPPHGLRRYDNKRIKCRCEICREARTTYDQDRYQRLREKRMAQVAAHRLANLERIREYDRQRCSTPEGREVARERARAWYRDNSDRAARAVAAYRQTEVGRSVKILSNHKRRSQKIGHATPEQVAARMAYFGNKCAYCKGPFEHIDHVKPLSKGGSLWPSNLRPSCENCNLRKGTKTLSAFLQRG